MIRNETYRKCIIQLVAHLHNLINIATKKRTLAEELERLHFHRIIEALEQRNGGSCEQMLRNHAMHFINQIKQNLYDEAEK